ncbi:hypothetical protein D3C87_224200 [compost metagenome]
MQVQIGNARIEASGAYVYIKAFGREVFIKREAGFPLMPYVRRTSNSKQREIWVAGFYFVI